MNEAQLRKQLLEQFGLRARPAMMLYVLDRLTDARDTKPIPILGADARTGAPVRQLLARDKLTSRVKRATEA